MYEKEALDPRTNYLATLQLSVCRTPDTPYEQRAIVAILRDPDVVTEMEAFLRELMKTHPVWIGHNFKFDLHQFNHHWNLKFYDQKIHDTMLCHILLKGARDYNPVNLKTVCEEAQLPEEIQKKSSPAWLSDWWSEELDEEQLVYASTDVFALHPLFLYQKEQMEANRLLRVRKLECTLTPRLVDVENVGICFDKEKLYEFLLRAKEQIKKYREEFNKVFAGCNPNSGVQILARIKKHYNVIPTKSEYDKKMGMFVCKESADKYALMEAGIYNEPAIQAYLAVKEIDKWIKMAEKWLADPDGKLTVNFFQLPIWGAGDDDKDGGARTGRMSTSPQLQNIEQFMKQFLIAPEGYKILSSDFKGIELCIMGSHSGDELLKLASTINLHKKMCSWAFEMDEEKVNKKGKEYRIAKETNFGFLYRMGGEKFCTRVLRASKGEIRLTREQGNAFRKTFFERYPGVGNYHTKQIAFGCRYGYVETRSGRRRYYNPADRPTLEQQYVPFWDPTVGAWVGPYTGEYPIYYKGRIVRKVKVTVVDVLASWRAADWKWCNICINHPIQGTGADGAKDAMILVCDGFRKQEVDARLFAMVHDSLDAFVRIGQEAKAIKIMDDGMVNGMKKYIPDIDVKAEHTIGRCWASPPADIRKDNYGLWVYPRDLSDDDLQEWMKNEFQQEVDINGVLVAS